MKILGIDPGYERMGVAILEQQGGKDIVLFSDCLITPKTDRFSARLLTLGAELEKILKKWKPEALAIEKLFFTNNQKTASAVAEVRGMVCYLAEKNSLTVLEYTPLEIKMSTCGYGTADKKQVIAMVDKLVKLPKKPKHDDEYDAVAAGLTGLARFKYDMQKQNPNS